MTSSQPYSERKKVMGEPAESAFTEWAETKKMNIVRYGLNQPPFKRFNDIPLFIRGTPDYLVEGKSKVLVECKGTGGRVLKLKKESLLVLEHWHDILPVWVFLFDSGNNRVSFTNFRKIEAIALQCPVKAFANDRKEYYEIPVRMFEWEDFSERKLNGY